MKVRTVLLFVSLAVVACSPKYLANTEVPDTDDNRVIVDLVDRYRQAIEERDVRALREMVSRNYFSNAGTTAESDDDYGYDQIEQLILPMLKQNIKKVQYSVFVKEVRFDGPSRAVAEFEHSFRYLYVVDGKDMWQAKVDFARLQFAMEDGVWRIVGGL